MAINATIAGDNVLNIAEQAAGITVTGTSTGAVGQTVTVTVNGGAGGTAVVAGDGTWSATIPAGNLAGIANGATVTLAANVSDAAGNPATEATRQITADLAAPTVTIDATIAGDNTINIAEAAAGFTVSGTSTAEVGRSVVVTVGGNPAGTATIQAGGTWSLAVPAGNLPVLTNGGTVEVLAAVTDAAGNLATPASRTLAVDIGAPTLAIAATVAGDNVLNIAEQAAGITVTGTSTGAVGQTVTVTVNGGAGGTAVVAGDGTWSATIPTGNLAGIANGATVTLAANVSDAAGNPATEATRQITADLAAPTVTIDSHADDGLVTGTSTGLATGATVNLTVGTESYTTTVNAQGAWQFQIPKAPAANTFVGLGQVFNTQQTATASVTDTAGNTGSFNGNVFIYKDAGLAMFESARTADTATYQIFQSEQRTGEQFRIAYDDAQSSFVSYTPRADFGLSSALPGTVDGQTVISVTMANLGNPTPAITVPIGTLVMSFDGGSSDVLASYSLRPASPDTLGGWSELFVGSSGGDTINVTAVDSIVRGRAGGDTINLAADGRNIVVFEASPTNNGQDAVNHFDLSNAKLPDAILFADLVNASLRGAGTDFQSVAFGGTLDADAGFVVMTTPLFTGGFNTIALGLSSLTNLNPLDSFYFMAGDTETALLSLVQVDGAGSITNTTMAQFNFIGDLSNLTADQVQNFV